MDQTERILLVGGVLIILCLIIAVIGIKQDKKIPFKINKRYLSDGSVQLEVLKFYKKNKKIMDEFYQRYSIGNVIFLDGQDFIISDMKKIRRDTLFTSQYVMNIYLEEEKWNCTHEVIFNNIVQLLTDDSDTLKDLAVCFSNPIQYYHKHSERFEDMLVELKSPKEIAWFSIINCLTEQELVWNFDVKTELETFLWGMRLLSEKKGLSIEDEWFPPFDGHCYVSQWCGILDERWQEQDFVVAAFDNDSDSYEVFICKKRDFEKLQCLAKKVNRRFALAKDM